MLPIQKKLIRYNHSNRNGKRIEYIVVHDTGNTGKGADVNAHFNYFNGGDRQSSADYFVDDHSIGQFVEDYNYAWHCGDGRGKYGITNSNSIGVEICINSDGNYVKAVHNAAELVRYLMKKYNVPISKVVRHYDASRKSCPGQIIRGKDGITWDKFKQLVLNSNSNTGSSPSPQPSQNGFYETNERRTNAIIVGGGNIQVLDKNCKPISNRYISNSDYVFIEGIYPSRKYIELVYPGGNKKYHAYISINNFNRIRFTHNMEYINDGGVTYVWWDAKDVNVKNHNEELKPHQKASPMYRTNGKLKIAFLRSDGTPSDGYVRFEGAQGTKFYSDHDVEPAPKPASKPTPAPKPNTQSSYGVVFNVSSHLNVRNNINGSVIGKVFSGEKVLIKWTKNGWHYIQYDTPSGKKEGYVSANYIKRI